jgi:hypothetical protein
VEIVQTDEIVSEQVPFQAEKTANAPQTHSAPREPTVTSAQDTDTAPLALEAAARSDESGSVVGIKPLGETDSPAPETPTPLPNETVAQTIEPESIEPEPIVPEGPLVLPEKGSPKFAFDYRGRLWVEKKRKGFFRQLRRPQLPPEEPD